MRLSNSYILLFTLLILSGCAREAGSFPEPQPDSEHPISWSVSNVNESTTRALVDNDRLEILCTPGAGGAHESIGVWGQARVTLGNEIFTYDDFVATPLYYAPRAEDTNPHSDWNYDGELRYWRSHAVYNIRACYPLDLMTNLMTKMDATQFQGGPINTSVLQEDILVAASEIETRTADWSKPIPLDLLHVFSALKFKVRAVDGFVPAIGEGITSCWLQNKTDDKDLFSPSGYFIHTGNFQPSIEWVTSESSMDPMYLWKHPGVSFANENTLYTSNGELIGNEYTQNDGWLLVVPQQVKENTLSFCYTMKNSPGHSFSVDIPSITYLPGKQYVYVLEIRGSEVNIILTIADWDYQESSYDIIM